MAIGGIIVFYFLYKIATFSIFGEIKFTELKTLSLPTKDYIIKVFYVPGSATDQRSIQVRKIGENKTEILSNYDRYDKLIECTVIGQDTLRLILGNSMFAESEPDTIYMNLNGN